MAVVQPEPWLRALITNNNNAPPQPQAVTLYVPSTKIELLFSEYRVTYSQVLLRVAEKGGLQCKLIP
jgi:hypothetical protein